MAVIVPNEGEQKMLNLIIGPDNLFCVLFKSNTTPSATTGVGDLTFCNFSGYGAQNIAWGTVTTDGGGKASVTGTQVDFEHDGGSSPEASNDVYGWAIVHDIAGYDALVAVERFADAPVTMSALDDIISVTPTLKLFD